MVAVGREREKLRIFISYSRADAAFADELKLGLEDRGYAIDIDNHSIRQGEEWRARLGKLIVSCDTVVFVLSPDSARSPVCQWEVEEAHAQGKRVIPILYRGLQEAPRGKQPDGSPWPNEPVSATERLNLINYCRFDEGRSFIMGLRGLVQALEDDLDWIEAHSRLAVRARDWDMGGRPTNRLMSGDDINDAKRLLETRKLSAPPILTVQLDYIQASQENEKTKANEREQDLALREQLLKESEVAVRLKEEAQRQRELAERRNKWLFRVAAVLGAALVVGAMWQNYLTHRQNARIFATMVQSQLEKGKFVQAMRLALYALPPKGSLPWDRLLPDLEHSLRSAAASYPFRYLDETKMSNCHFSKDEATSEPPEIPPKNKNDRYVRIQSSGNVVVWGPGTSAITIYDSRGVLAQELRGHETTGKIMNLGTSFDGRFLAFTDATTLRVYEIQSSELLSTVQLAERQIYDVGFNTVDQSVCLRRDGDIIAVDWRKQLALPRGNFTSAAFINPESMEVLVIEGTGGNRAKKLHRIETLEFNNEAPAGVRTRVGFGFGSNANSDKSCGGRPFDGIIFPQRLDRGIADGKLIDCKTGRVVSEFTDGGVWDYSMSPNGKFFAISPKRVIIFGQSEVQVRRADNGDLVTRLLGNAKAVFDVKFSQDGSSLYTVDSNGYFRQWDAKWFYGVPTTTLAKSICDELLIGNDILDSRELSSAGIGDDNGEIRACSRFGPLTVEYWKASFGRLLKQKSSTEDHESN